MSEERTVSVRVRAMVGDYQAAMAKARVSTQDFERDARRLAVEHKQSMTAVGVAAAATGTALVAAFGAATAQAIKFESSFAGVRKTVTGTDAELAAISDGIRRMAREIPTGVNELNGIAEAAGQLGIQTPAILGFTRVMADLGETTNLSGGEGATSLARLANITQMAQGDFDRLGSTIVALGNNLETTEAEIVEMGLRLAGAGAQVGMTEAEILALAGSLSSVGVEAEAGGSAFSRVMVEINKAVMSGGDNLAVFAEVAGQSAGQFAAAWQDNAAGGLTAFVQGLARVQAEGGNVDAVLEALELEGIRVADALKRSAGAGDLMAEALELGSSAWETNTALTDEAAQRYATVEAKLQVAKNALVDLGISVGEQVLPAIAGLADGTANVVGWFADLPEPVQKATGLLLGASGSILVVAGGAAILLPRMLELRDALDKLGIQAGTLRSKLGRGAGLATALFLTGTAVSAVTNAIDDLVSNRGDLSKLTDDLELLAATGAATGNLNDAVGGIDGIVRALDSLADPSLADNVQGLFSRLIDGAGQLVTLGQLDVRGTFHQMGVELEAVDGALASLVGGGRAEAAATSFKRISDAAASAGIPIDTLLEAFPEYATALKLVEVRQDDTSASVSASADAYNDALGPVAELTERQEALARALEEFESPWQTYDRILDAKIAADRKAAEATARATKSSSDSWEDFVNDVDVSLTEYVAALEEQIAAQEAWEDNLIKVAGRAGSGFAHELAQLGPDAAVLIADLATATDSELELVVQTFSRRGRMTSEEWGLGFESRIDQAGLAVDALNDLAADRAAELYQKMYDAGLSGAVGLKNGLTAGAGGVYDSTWGLAQQAIEGARTGLDSHSPSRVFEQLGRDTVQGYINGLDDLGMDAVAATRSLMGDAVDAADDVLSAWRAGQAAGSAGEGLAAAIGQVGSLEDRQDALPELIARARRRLGDARREASRITPEEQARIYAAEDQLRRAEEALAAADGEEGQGRLSNDVLVAQNRLTDARKEATAPTREVADAERELNALLAEHAEIGELLAEASAKVEEAELKVLDAELRLLSTTNDLDAANAQLASETLTAVASQAGVTITSVDSLTAAYARLIAQTRELEKAASAPIAGASDASVTNAFKSVGVDPGSVIDEADWRAAARKVQHDPGVRLDPSDKQMILDLISKQGNTYNLGGIHTQQVDVAEQIRRMELLGGLAP